MINDVHISPEYVLTADGEWQTDVPASLQFSDVTELRVYLNGEELAWDDGYIEYDKANDKYVAHVVNGKKGDRVVIARWCSFSQEVNLHNYQAYDREVFEGMFDKLTKMCGELKEKTDRAVLARIGISDEDFETWRAGVVEPNRLSIGTVTKGDTPDDASASITGTAPDLQLNLVLPKGDQGEQGVQGIQGIQGEKGDANTLTIGTVTKGDTASATITGDAPNQTLNLVLPKGDTGATGATGAKGDTGDSAYQAWLNAGNTGSEADFIASLKGEKGDKGDKGDTGATGATGAQGVQGDKGDKGDTGNSGADGVSPTATVTQTATGAVVTITDKNGTTSATLTNGSDGGYTLPAATSNSLGGVKVGSNLSVTSDGTLSADVSSSEVTALSVEVSNISNSLFGISDTANSAMNDILTHGNNSAIHVPSSGTTGHVLTKTASGNAWQELTIPDVTIPQATNEELGGIKVDGYGLSLNDYGALRINTPNWGGIAVQDGELTVMIGTGLKTNSGSIEVAPATSSAIGGIKVGNNLSITSDGTLSASGASATNAYTTLSGTAVTISPAVKPYKLTADAAVTLTASGCASGSAGYAELVVVVGASGSIAAGSNLTLVDALTASKTNYCIIRWEGTAASLFVWRTE